MLFILEIQRPGRETDHADDLEVDGLGEDAAAGRDVVDELGERGALHLLALEVGQRVEEVEAEAALAQLAQEQLLLLAHRHVCHIADDEDRQRIKETIPLHRAAGRGGYHRLWWWWWWILDGPTRSTLGT